GMAHRDVKPANCLVTPEGELRLTDFGLVGRAAAADPDAAAGTPAYMAPEQWESLAASGPPVDVYAFGVTLWGLLAGRRPFELDAASWRGEPLPPVLAQLLAGDTTNPSVARAALRIFHERVAPPRLRDVDPTISVELDELVTACLAKSAEARPRAAAVR